MILYSLQCGHGHVFDDWFSNSADCDAKIAAAELACPQCADTRISKAIMAPSIGKPAAEPPPQCPVSGCQGGACAFADDF